ncbi:MAG: tRNA (N6-isopentenyl adenosine(37)-C2)-methylthiotransferase MiaB [Deltaproteobacteria bacterium]|jgi:tRNA-2-methylthio-N6-dimethylallyladenosine synthase|nr:tRNA (N6-isopentenyl adenosine(37)-C2)-methylthiotransferase MiaB [Deltaproteobacteria bacterium]
MPRLFFIITFGCQMNVYDSGHLSTLLEKKGWLPASSKEEADFIFFNTCSIREKAARRVITHVRALKSLKKQKPDLLVGVGGCVAEQEGLNLIRLAPEVDLITGPRRLAEIPNLLEKLERDKLPLILTGEGTPEKDKTAYLSPKKAPLCAFLTIMEGCNNFCAYCVVPYLRGREVSREPEEILTEARNLLQNGAREITLLGQNVNSYHPNSLNLPQGEAFRYLLEEVNKLPNLWRLRFTTSHPKDFPPHLAQLFATLQNLASHLHLPLQSGSNRILKAMGRHYDRETYLEIVSALRVNVPNIAITTDIITGFPGETEKDFEDTLDILKTIRFDALFSFKYSDRPQTAALNLSPKVPEDEKSQRLEIINKVQREISTEINSKLLNTIAEVLVEGRGRLPSQLSGRLRNNKIVNFMGPEELIGELVPVKITQTGPVSLGGILKTPSRTLDFEPREISPELKLG